jgi:hypothetical protein
MQSHDNEWVGNDQVQVAKVRIQGGWRVTGLHSHSLDLLEALQTGCYFHFKNGNFGYDMM